jgi:endonuclease/exonuclease/phosphatase family metal-dependent hydrolase
VIRLVSYNIKFGGRGRELAIAEVIKGTGADAVLLQEATDPRVVERLAQETGLSNWGSRPDYSMGFITRIPVAHHHWHHPVNSRHPFLELALEGVECRIFGLHLVAWFSKWTERKRARELRALLDGIRDHQNGFHLIAGDFNALAPGELLEVRKMPRWIRAMVWLSGNDIARDTIQLMLDEGYSDAWRNLHPKDAGFTFPTWDPHVRLDYVFVPKRDATRIAVCEIVNGNPDLIKTASDHAPILVEMR